jgi:hypothetical protein
MDDIKNSPIKQAADGIVLRAGWHSILHKYDFTKEYPWLPDAIRKARLSNRYQINLLYQIIVKIQEKLKRSVSK